MGAGAFHYMVLEFPKISHFTFTSCYDCSILCRKHLVLGAFVSCWKGDECTVGKHVCLQGEMEFSAVPSGTVVWQTKSAFSVTKENDPPMLNKFLMFIVPNRTDQNYNHPSLLWSKSEYGY